MLLVSASAGYGAWKYGPGTDLDRAVFSTVAQGLANPPLFVTGQGSMDSPWKLRVFSSESKPERKLAPVVVSIGDDRDGFFQEAPPAPIDLALVFTNLKRLGKTRVASGAVLAWQAPDPIGLAALEKSLGGFESLVMASPLSRGAVASSMPPAFRRASISLSTLHGEASALPVVNRISIPNVVLAGEKTLAGYSFLESEPSTDSYPLVARWEDRVVFSFALLSVLQRLDLPIEGVEVRLGEYLKLGDAGPFVRIDGYGRMALPPKKIPARAEIPAEAVIGSSENLFSVAIADPVILRDDQSAAEPGTRGFSQDLTTIVAAIASGEGLGQAKDYPRLDWKWEIGMVSFFVVALTLSSVESWRHFCFLILVGVCLSAQWIAFGIASIWLPGLSVFAAIGAAFVVAILIGAKTSASVALIPLPQAEIKIPPAPEVMGLTPFIEKESAKKSTKAPVKTTTEKAARPPAKKAAKKAVPKKQANPKTPRKKK